MLHQTSSRPSYVSGMIDLKFRTPVATFIACGGSSMKSRLRCVILTKFCFGQTNQRVPSAPTISGLFIEVCRSTGPSRRHRELQDGRKRLAEGNSLRRLHKTRRRAMSFVERRDVAART